MNGESSPSTVNPPPPAAGQPSGHTAVVFVHGIGSQRRYGETSRLLESLETYARDPDPGLPADTLRGFHVHSESSPDPECGDVTFIEVGYNDSASPIQFRFYEVYWAPITAVGVPFKDVLAWMFRQVSNPWKVISTPWRDRARQLRAGLHDLWWKLSAAERGEPSDLAQLLACFEAFQSIKAREDYPGGSYNELSVTRISGEGGGQ